MIEVRETEVFKTWLAKLRDRRARTKIVTRVLRLAEGNPGDVAPVGEGVSEMRIHYGAGYRVYFKQHGHVVVLILCGGDKDTQAKDIKDAQQLAANWKE